ncbi:hypothetical protein IC006_2496 [Sulfuracidifex tepidarius]|uniref:Formamidase n=1 Tax=Sulfuracidifex tepidarius TaxID=1294262 RepID=A0A510E5Y5_9CREN|nr:hypothetical protein IC006_2496 [Sulfuracidifex tepidarius]BBG27952.1 hypothetical protein IC007_2507 [Sulfuracidifex tepidarius]
MKPAIYVKDGDTVELEVKEASDGQIRRNSDLNDVTNLDFSRIHPLTGPIFVEGAEPGDALKVEILDIHGEGWGWTAVIPGFGFLSKENDVPEGVNSQALKIWSSDEGYVSAKFGDIYVKVKEFPFPGVIGTGMRLNGVWSTIPPRENGGNMDVKQMTVSSRIYFPVFRKGALLSVGDTHLAQGDGEVCGSAVEAPTKVKLRVEVVKSRNLKSPVFVSKPREAEYDGDHITFMGFSNDLWNASLMVVKEAISFLSNFMEPVEAYMLLSTVMDLKVSQVVDVPNWTVSGFIPVSVFGNKGGEIMDAFEARER